MREYYEALETVEIETGIEPDFIRIDITDMNVLERTDTLTEIKDAMNGITCRFKYHICGHDDGLLCEVQDI